MSQKKGLRIPLRPLQFLAGDLGLEPRTFGSGDDKLIINLPNDSDNLQAPLCRHKMVKHLYFRSFFVDTAFIYA
jgi:hypothetical protein